jgi:hypothetical protein
MAVANGYGKTVTSGSVFMYDMGDIVNSYRGEPTTNDYGYNFRDFTGTGYAPYGQWSETTVTKTYLPNLNTPIGPGGTLMVESTTSGWQGLSRYGGGSESGAHTLSAFIYPLTNNINNFTIGLLGDGGNMIFFDLTTNTITYGAGISNGNGIIQPVPGYPGWFRVGANFEGREGGWVGSIGYNMYQQYGGTGTLRSMYITGIQYEYKTHVTPFTPSSRSATQGLLPLVGNSTLDLSNVSFDSNAQITFDGTDDYIITDNMPAMSNWTTETIINLTNYTTSQKVILDVNLGIRFEINNGRFNSHFGNGSGWVYTNLPSSFTYTANKYYHVVITVQSGGSATMYINGELNNTTSIGTGTTPSVPMYIGRFTGATGYEITGYLPVVKVYNRALSAAEVRQNYNKYKTRFNLA